jgi:hypothetical protein
MAWEEEEEEFLRENGATMTVRELHEGLRPVSDGLKSNETIRAKCKTMGIKPLQDGRRPWTDKEVEFLEKNRNQMSTPELATALNRTYRSVVAKCRVVPAGPEFIMKRITPWMSSMLTPLPGNEKSIYDLSMELYEAGKRVEIVEKGQKLALMCKVRR